MRFNFRSLQPVAVALLLLTLTAVSCKRDGASTARNPAALAAVRTQLDILRDSVDMKWRTMTASDDQKIGTTGLLIRELQTQPNMDAAQLAALLRANDRLKTRRYDQLTMAESSRIDAYDSAQDSLLHVLFPVAAPNNEAPTENIRNFVEGVQDLDNQVVAHRLRYDAAAIRYNNYLRLHAADLEHLGGKYADLKPLPVFTIGAE